MNYNKALQAIYDAVSQGKFKLSLQEIENLKVVGSNPASATKKIKGLENLLTPYFLDLAQ